MNEQLINEIADRLKKDILSSKTFLQDLLKDLKIKKENLDPEVLLFIMAQTMAKLSAFTQPPIPKSNLNISSLERKETTCRKPISITPNSDEAKIVADILVGNNVYLYGKAGTGKTYLAEAIAECVLRQPTYMITCSQWTSPIDIKGGQTITGYKEGQLVEAWANGGILILDELAKLDPNTAGLLNQALAETASQPRYNPDGTVIESTIPTITNGKGEIIKKGQKAKNEDGTYKEYAFRFGVIATGNTDMKTVANQYSGNQKQDYSLVDRFAGSYYMVDYSPEKEIALTYTYVYKVASAIRKYLDEQSDVIESISLRTMLNFNRTYEQYMLYKIQSPYADKIYDNEGNEVAPKSFKDSLTSFRITLPPSKQEGLLNYDYYKQSLKIPEGKSEDEIFIDEFKLKYGKDPETKRDLSMEEIQDIGLRIGRK